MLQVLIVEFGSVAFAVVEGGLSAKYWGLCLAIGAATIPVRAFINLMFILVFPGKDRSEK